MRKAWRQAVVAGSITTVCGWPVALLVARVRVLHCLAPLSLSGGRVLHDETPKDEGTDWVSWRKVNANRTSWYVLCIWWYSLALIAGRDRAYIQALKAWNWLKSFLGGLPACTPPVNLLNLARLGLGVFRLGLGFFCPAGFPWQPPWS